MVSTGNSTAEKDHPSNLSLAGDGFDTVIKAKAAVDAVPACANQVSCADILALATRDVIGLVRRRSPRRRRGNGTFPPPKSRAAKPPHFSGFPA
jgi:peroxidase